MFPTNRPAFALSGAGLIRIFSMLTLMGGMWETSGIKPTSAKLKSQKIPRPDQEQGMDTPD